MNIRNNIETTRVVNSKINLSILNSKQSNRLLTAKLPSLEISHCLNGVMQASFLHILSFKHEYIENVERYFTTQKNRLRKPYQRRIPEMQRLYCRINALETLTRSQRIDIARLTNENLSLNQGVARLQNRLHVLETKLYTIHHESNF